jgi:hypothetical protein
MDIRKVWLELLLAFAAIAGLIGYGIHQVMPVVTDWWSAHWILASVVAGIVASGATCHRWVPLGWRAYVAWTDRADMQRTRAQHQLMLASIATKMQEGFDTDYHNQPLGLQFKVHNPYTKASQVKVQEINGQDKLQIAAPKDALPNIVRYEDIRTHIPADHALVGVDSKGIITRQRAIKALTWVVGGSGSGKTNTVCIRVDEDYEWGHRFLVIDPHWFKDDSMYNAIKGYSDRFLMPVAYETEDILQVLNAFLGEFKRRKGGGSWEFPITILIDEVGSLTTDKPEDDQEKEMIDKIKQVARICGQESRGFEMTGMYISQDAAGLAWLRKRAIMVLAHQLLMMSERMLACNQNAEIAKDMDNWPKGRTLVYGIAFQGGQKVVQQPMFQPRVVESTIEKVSSDWSSEVFQQSSCDIDAEGSLEADGRLAEEKADPSSFELKKLIAEIGKMKNNGMSNDAILKQYGLNPGGRNNQNLKAVAEVISELEAEEV